MGRKKESKSIKVAAYVLAYIIIGCLAAILIAFAVKAVIWAWGLI